MSKKRDHKKRVYTVILSFLAVLFLLARVPTNERLTAHAADQKSKITKQVNTYMSAIKKYDIEKIRSMQIDKDVFHISDKYMQKYIRRINKEHFTYEIKKIKAKGSTATVYMHVRTYSSKDDFSSAISLMFYYFYKKSWSSEKFGKELYELLINEYEPVYYPEMYDKNVKITMTKKGNKWMINKMDKNIFYFKDGGLTYYLYDFSKHVNKYL